MSRKLKSGIIGQAQVIFGGAIGLSLGTVKNGDDETLAIGMAELTHPAAAALMAAGAATTLQGTLKSKHSTP